MAVVTVKSQAITDQDASPRVAPQAGTGGGYRVKEIDSFASVANGDSIASKYILFRVPSTIRVKDLWLENGAITGAIADIGIYYASRQEDVGAGVVAGSVIDADFFASVTSLVAGNAVPLNVTNESTTYLLSLRDNPLWEALGLTSDPGGKFDIVATLTAASTAAGLIYMKMGYVE